MRRTRSDLAIRAAVVRLGLRCARTLRRAVPALALAVAALFPPAPAAAQDIGLPIGSTPGAAVVQDLEGNAVDLASFVGKGPLIVEFWATWCPLCAALEPQLHQIEQRYGDAIDVLIVAVGVNQSPRSIQRHLSRHDLPGTLVFDGRGQATRAFRAPATSYIVALDAAGKVVYTGQGEDQDLMKAAGLAVGGASRD